MPKPQGKLHRERSQPANRAKFGLLEKHKDYVKRAADFHRKERRLKALQVRAAYKNPDEFYFGMIRSRVTAVGEHRKREVGQNSLPNDVVALLKTQDLAYVQRQRVLNDKAIRLLREQIITEAPTRTHIKFSADEEEDEALQMNTVDSTGPVSLDEDLVKELQAREERAEKLRLAEDELQGQRDRMTAKGRCIKTVDEDGKKHYRWLPERQK